MATVKELDTQWEAQYLVVQAKNTQRVALINKLFASSAYQNANQAERAELAKTGPVEEARLAFNAENQKLTALKLSIDAAKKEEAAAANNSATALSPDEITAINDASTDANVGANTKIKNYTASALNEAALIEQKQSDDNESVAETARFSRHLKESVAESNEYMEFDPRPNLLLDYADYTYALSLHVIPPKKYNTMMTTPGYVYNTLWTSFVSSTSGLGTQAGENEEITSSLGTVLVASGGRQGSQYSRHPNFKEDFYFENLQMKTIVGMNVRTKNTNAIEMSFTLIEPYGITFLDRLLKITNQIGTKSWMQIPYMLQVDFLGNNSAGELLTPIPNQTKYIPIKILACKIKVTNKGAEYQIQAMPFGQQAFTESLGSTPAILEVQASTVGDFFSSTGSAGQASSILAVDTVNRERLDSNKKEITDEQKKTNPNDKRIAELNSNANSVTNDLAKTPYLVGSYAAAINSYQTQLAAGGHLRHAEVYQFDIHPDLAKSKIVIPATITAARTTMTDPVKALRNNAKVSNVGINQSISGFSINAGTSIIDVINMVMRNSDFVRDQLHDPATDAKKTNNNTADSKNTPMSWFKITSTIELLEFDITRDTYSKKITYHIMPTAIFNTKFPNAPTSEPRSVTKEYHYLYSGKNENIINFDLDFDTMFYTAITADRSKVQQTEVQQENPENTTQPINAGTGAVQITNRQIKLISGHADIPRTTNPDSKSELVNDFYKSSLSASRGDMINVKLKIIGDPEFIKQDDIFFNPITNPDQHSGKLIDKNGSIMFDKSERFVLLTFNTPVDVNPETGLVEIDSEYSTSAFSGIYKIIVVDNEFSSGAFTQTLELIRIFDNFPNTNNNRSSSPTAIADTKSNSKSRQELDAEIQYSIVQLPATGAGAGRGGQGGATAEERALYDASRRGAGNTLTPQEQMKAGVSTQKLMSTRKYPWER